VAIVTVSRRSALQLMAFSAGAIALAACNVPAPSSVNTPLPSAPTPSAPGGAQPATASGAAASQPSAPRIGGVLRTGSAVSIASLEPHVAQGWTTSETTWLPYDRLIAYDLQFKAQPMLAESWEASLDQRQIQFNLRKGVGCDRKWAGGYRAGVLAT
jgi:ABC-type transport system substrate-binding protein